MNFYNKHYIRIDNENNIVHGFSDAFEQPQEGDILINEQGGRQFEFYINGNIYLGANPSLRDFDGKFLYKWDGKEVVSVQIFRANANLAIS